MAHQAPPFGGNYALAGTTVDTVHLTGAAPSQVVAVTNRSSSQPLYINAAGDINSLAAAAAGTARWTIAPGQAIEIDLRADRITQGPFFSIGGNGNDYTITYV